MLRIVIGIFIILHGLVHLLYFALSRRLVELDTPIVGWPEQSWVFSPFLGDSTTRWFASGLYGLATMLFVVSGLGVLFRTSWGEPLLVGAAVFSSVTVVLFWEGKMQQLADKGFLGLLINVVILGAVFGLK